MSLFSASAPGQPIPHPKDQETFPYRPSQGQPAQNDVNEQFAAECFQHLGVEGEKKRQILVRFLCSGPWLAEDPTPNGELNHFGTRHSGKDYECCFCANHYGSLPGVTTCIKKHIIYHP